MRCANPSGIGSNSKSIRALSGSMFPPVTGTFHSFQITPHKMCIAVCVRISWKRRSASTRPDTVVPTAGTSPSNSCHTHEKAPSVDEPLRTFTTRAPARVPVSCGWPPPVG